MALPPSDVQSLSFTQHLLCAGHRTNPDTGRVQLSAWCHRNSQVSGIIGETCVVHSMPHPKLLTGLLKHSLFLGWALARFDRYTEAGTGQADPAPGRQCLWQDDAGGSPF